MDSRQIKMTDDRLQKLSTTQKKETTQYSTTKLPWFSDLLRHSARKRGALLNLFAGYYAAPP